MRVLVVDLLCNSPFYCAPFVRALSEAGVTAELASPLFYLEPEYLATVRRPDWIVDFVVHTPHPRALRLAVRALELSLNAGRMLRRIRAAEYGVVHVQWVPFEERSTLFMRLLRRACRRGGARLVMTAHNAVPHDRPRANLAAIRENLDQADEVIAQSTSVADALRRVVGTRVPIEVIPHGPLFLDETPPARAEAARRLAVAAGAPTVLFLGLIRPYKGLDLLADAWPAVREHIRDARLLVVGKPTDDGVSEGLHRLRGLSGVTLDDRYVSVARMLDYHAVSDVVVFPYRGGSQSGALMTAVGLGRPTVVTPIAGLREQASAIGSVTVADAVSASALAAALIASLADRDGRRDVAERDRTALASSELGWQAIARRTIAGYEGGPTSREGSS